MARLAMGQKETTGTPETALPTDGGIVERDGIKYQFTKVPTGTTTWDAESQRLIPRYHTLRTWFAHTTEGIGPGPGWDARLALPQLSEKEMLERYGHAFTADEISAPAGRWETSVSGEELVGGMPDDIPYYDLKPVDEPR